MKGSGNSRYLKTVGEALSLYPTYEDFLQAMIAGTFPVDFNGINKDGWTQQGTLLNKANLLSDTVISTLGLSTGANSTPNDAFNVLANIGNVHVWRKTVITEEAIPAGYTLGSIQTNVEVFSGGSQSQSILWYNDSPDVDAAGNVLVKNGPGSNNYVFYANSNFNIDEKMVGKFIEINPGRDYTAIPGVWFVPSDAMVTVRDYKIYSSKIQKVTGYPAVPPGTHITYLTSTNRNAYQEGDDAKEAGYVLGDMVTGNFKMGSTVPVAMNDFYYVDTPTVSDDGVVFVPTENTSKISVGYGSDFDASTLNVLRGKFVMRSGNAVCDAIFYSVIYIPADATFTRSAWDGGDGYTYYLNKYQPVTGYPAIPAGTTIEYLGVLGDKTSIETGSYVGTGTSGSGNPNTLTFGFEPKFVHIQSYSIGNGDSTGYGFAFFLSGARGFTIGPSSSNDLFSLNAKFNKNILSWYQDNEYAQLNEKSVKYFFAALG